MNAKYLACIALFCALVAPAAQAAPALSVVPNGLNGGNREWLVSIAPDASLFANHPPNGVGGSMAVELAFSVDDPVDLVNVIAPNPADWEHANPGLNPFTGTITNGIYLDLVGDRTFAAYGSTYFTTPAPSLFLKITTAGSGPTTMRYGTAASGNINKGNIIAQAALGFIYSGTVSVPEPAAAFLAVMMVAPLALSRNRRRSV